MRSEGDLARRLVMEQRKRAVGTIMGAVENLAHPHMPHKDRQALRLAILNGIGAYHDFVLDVLKVKGDDMVQNEETLRVLRELHHGQRQIADAINGRSDG